MNQAATNPGEATEPSVIVMSDEDKKRHLEWHYSLRRELAEHPERESGFEVTVVSMGEPYPAMRRLNKVINL